MAYVMPSEEQEVGSRESCVHCLHTFVSGLRETSSVRFLCHIYEVTEAIQMYIFMFDELEMNYQISKSRTVLMTTGGIGISLLHT